MAPTYKNPIVEEENVENVEGKASITEHILVPVHRIMNEEEKKALLEKYSIKAKQLPKISIKDPVIKLLKEAKLGDVVEIKRRSTTAGEAVYYRVIIK